MGDDLDDRDAVSPDYSVALLARYPLARLGRQFAPVDADDCAPGLETERGDDWIRRDAEGMAALSALCHLTDYDRDRPSPGDDITRPAFDEMDGYRRSNDSSDGGTP